MTEINLDDYVLESKAELTSLADVIREKSKVTGELSVADMKAAVEGISGGDDSALSALIDRSITTIETPSGVKTIGRNAFSRCSNLKKVVLNEGLETIGQTAFAYCEKLNEIILPYGLKKIEQSAFYECKKLEKVELPPTLETIESSVFGVTAIKVITLPNSIKSIATNALSTNVTTVYCEWAEGEGPAGAPWGAANAEVIYVGSTRGVTFSDEVNDDGGYTVTGLDMEQYSGEPIDLVIGPQHNGLPVTAIADHAFNGGGRYDPLLIKTVSFPDTLKTIGDFAFADQYLTSVTIPDGVTEVGTAVFFNNRSLKTAELGAGCKNMPSDVFDGCSLLTSITAHWDDNVLTNAPWGAKNAEVVYDATYGTYGLQYEYDAELGGYAVTGYQYDGDSFSSSVVIPSIYNGKRVVMIGNDAFCECYGLTSITIPDGIKIIGDWAFSWCNSLTSITIPNSVTSIGEYAFSDCHSLTSITIPDGVTSIGEYAFSECDGLTSILIPSSVTCIGDEAFFSCNSLTSITIPSSVTSIGEYAFSECDGLTDIYCDWSEGDKPAVEANAPWGATNAKPVYSKNTKGLQFTLNSEGTAYTVTGYVGTATDVYIASTYKGLPVESIAEDVFTIDPENRVGQLTSIEIEDGVKSIGNFIEQGLLVSVKLPSTLLSIGDYAFYYCNRLTSITIPDGVTSIGEKAFSECDGLTSITIPDGVTSIGDEAFLGCNSLTSITIPNSVTSIGDWAFCGCDGLTSITIPNSVTSIGEYAFRECYGLTSILIPSSVTSIGEKAFSECDGLTYIFCDWIEGDKPAVEANAPWGAPSTAVINYVPAEWK